MAKKASHVQKAETVRGRPPPPWPFLEQPSTATLSLKRIFHDGRPVLRAVHDPDGAWQMLDDDDVSMDQAMVVSLGEVLDHDPTLAQVACLPRGWYAVRKDPASPWWVAPNGVSISEAYAGVLPGGDKSAKKKGRK